MNVTCCKFEKNDRDSMTVAVALMVCSDCSGGGYDCYKEEYNSSDKRRNREVKQKVKKYIQFTKTNTLYIIRSCQFVPTLKTSCDTLEAFMN